MPGENTEKFIRSGHKRPEDFQPDTLKTVTVSENEGIQAVVGKPKCKDAMEIVSYLFEKAKGWTVEKAKEWLKKHERSNRHGNGLASPERLAAVHGHA